jgi:hypothetical protein
MNKKQTIKKNSNFVRDKNESSNIPHNIGIEKERTYNLLYINR